MKALGYETDPSMDEAVTTVAKAVHDSIRLLQAHFGKDVQPAWEEIDAYQREAVLGSIIYLAQNPTENPMDLPASKLGPDAPFQIAKARLYRAAVDALIDYI